jgi:(4S)-4-hydroxy-5-phosphonooxypentane-2,3-dione isomerase
MGLHVVVVEFSVIPRYVQDFEHAVLENARETLRSENGCRAFEVVRHSGTSEFLLYELYVDALAFAEHLATGHFAAFDALTAPWIEEKCIKQYERLNEALPRTFGE